MRFREYGFYETPSQYSKLLDFGSTEHAMWQLISRIDNEHKSKHNQLYVQELEYLKATVLLTCLANCHKLHVPKLVLHGQLQCNR